jgi:hypothetical protein
MTKETEFDYAAFEKATGHMTALAIVKDGQAIGRIIIKPGRDGAARLTAYAQVWGAPMVAGYARGYGYDKRGAALSSALCKLDSCLTRSDALDLAAIGHIVDLRAIGQLHCQFDAISNAISDAGYQLLRAL